MANSATDKLLKILKLEAERGYQDKAVTRGLASFANAWLADAAKSNIESAWAESVAEEMRAYSAAADLTTRRAGLNALMTRLQSPTLNAPGGRTTHTPTPVQDIITPAPPPSRSEQSRTAPSGGEKTTSATRPQQAPNDRARRPPSKPRIEPAASEGRPETTLTQPASPESTALTEVEEHNTSDGSQTQARPAARVSPSQRQLDQFQAQSKPRVQTARYSGIGLDAPVSSITGIGEQNAQRFAKLGVTTIRDLLYFFPTRYDDYSALKTINQLVYGETVTIIGRVEAVWKHRAKTGLYIVRVRVEDQSGVIDCSWFTNEHAVDYTVKQFQVGREVVISGKVTEYLGKLTFQNPAHEPAEKEWVVGGSIVPVYRLTEGLMPLMVRRTMRRLIEYWPPQVPEFVPPEVRRDVGLMGIADAMREIHWPKDFETQERARRRLAFDELFILQLAIAKQRRIWQGAVAQPLPIAQDLIHNLVGTLPYTLTGAQERAVNEISADLHKPFAMHRLLQGDVGSGKTVVAALAMALVASVDAQSALMAPTEILAEQHYKNLSILFSAMSAKGATKPIQVRLLTGSVKAADKRAIYESLADGSVQVAIGTHALIQEGVEFKNLGLVVVDEQHRFGVEQRKALRQKGREANPHTLVMTATPIPRTLALTLYGDLDNTVLDEMPPGRQPIETHWFAPVERERAYSFVRQQIAQGRQAFIICPLITESDKIEAKAATEEHARLQSDIFPHYKLGLLHGRMKADEKESVMSAFVGGEINILVSTSVVEVGIDVPNATVMMIEGAERFGLSQLHQFRGRVGRGQYPSYCLLIADSSAAVSDERLQAIVSTQDGFKLAEKDLEIRGPGEFFGTRQSGEPELKLVSIGDRDLLMQAREHAERIFEHDPQLSEAGNSVLAEKIEAFWSLHRSHGDAS